MVTATIASLATVLVGAILLLALWGTVIIPIVDKAITTLKSIL